MNSPVSDDAAIIWINMTKLRQSEAEYAATRDMAIRKSGPVWGGRLYVCRRCQANFRNKEGEPDLRTPGIGRCRSCADSLPEKPGKP